MSSNLSNFCSKHQTSKGLSKSNCKRIKWFFGWFLRTFIDTTIGIWYFWHHIYIYIIDGSCGLKSTQTSVWFDYNSWLDAYQKKHPHWQPPMGWGSNLPWILWRSPSPSFVGRPYAHFNRRWPATQLIGGLWMPWRYHFRVTHILTSKLKWCQVWSCARIELQAWEWVLFVWDVSWCKCFTKKVKIAFFFQT